MLDLGNFDKPLDFDDEDIADINLMNSSIRIPQVKKKKVNKQDNLGINRAEIVKKESNLGFKTSNFWNDKAIPSELKNMLKYLSDYITSGDIAMSLHYIRKIDAKMIKDTSLIDYLRCLLTPTQFVSPLPMSIRTKHVLVSYTYEVTLSSAAAISIHWNVGALNSTSPNNVLTNIVNNGVIPDAVAVNYINNGFVLPAGLYTSICPVAACLQVEAEGNDFNENGRIYITSTADDTVNTGAPATYSAYTVPTGYTNQMTKSISHIRKGGFALYTPANERFTTFQQITPTSNLSLLNGALIEALVIGSNLVPVVASFTTIFMAKPSPLNSAFLGSSVSKPGKPVQIFDLGNIIADSPQLLAGTMDQYRSESRQSKVDEAILQVPGIETDDWLSALMKGLGAVIPAITGIVSEFTK
jgi:hypothetical protein